MDSKLIKFYSNYEILQKKYFWKLDKTKLSLISAIYVINNKELDVFELDEFTRTMNQQVGVFSIFYKHYYLCAYLIAKYPNYHEKFRQLLNIFKTMREHNLPKNHFTIITALSLLDEEDHVVSKVKLIKHLYQTFKMNHFYFTQSHYYPMISLLSDVTNDATSFIEHLTDYHHKLLSIGFKKGKSLHLLTLLALTMGYKDDFAHQCLDVKIKLSSYRIKTNNYPIIGLLTTTELNESNKNQLIKYIDTVSDINLGSILFLADKIPNKKLLEITLLTITEREIQKNLD